MTRRLALSPSSPDSLFLCLLSFVSLVPSKDKDSLTYYLLTW